jgi:hypothetical protein
MLHTAVAPINPWGDVPLIWMNPPVLLSPRLPAAYPFSLPNNPHSFHPFYSQPFIFFLSKFTYFPKNINGGIKTLLQEFYTLCFLTIFRSILRKTKYIEKEL